MKTENKKYKDSGIPWIGEIPEDWEVRRARDTVSIIRGGSPRPIENYISGNNEGYNWIKIGDTIKGSKYIVSTKSKIIEEGLNKTRFVHKDDLILTNSMSFGEPYILKIDGCIHDGWVAFSNYKDITKEFLYYLLISPLCRLQFEQQVAGGVVQNLNIDKIGTTQILLPPLPTQQRIADYLDRKCSEIDELAALQETMIAELKRYKQSVITEAVTKGLDPNVPMKDSGVEWIGEIPEDWEVNLLGSLFTEHKLKNDNLAETNLLSLSYGKIIRKNIDSVGGLLPMSYEGYNIIDRNDIVLRMTDLQNDHKSLRTGLCKERGIITSAYITIRLRAKQNSEYLHYLLHSYDINKVFYGMGDGVRQGINFADIKSLLLLCPPLTEQQAIADYLDEKCSEIDELIAIKQQKIEQLKEYKKSVIFEYVTGKKEVL